MVSLKTIVTFFGMLTALLLYSCASQFDEGFISSYNKKNIILEEVDKDKEEDKESAEEKVDMILFEEESPHIYT